MTIEEIKELINSGEKIDVEFKKSQNELNKEQIKYRVKKRMKQVLKQV